MRSYKIANALTICRILLIPVVITLLFLSRKIPVYQVVALLVLVFMQASDILDGYFARLARRKASTENPFGRLMDPIADKLYINSTYITLSVTHGLPKWITITIVVRDIVIVGGWLLRAILTEEKGVNPNFWGKVCDSCQALLIFAFLLNVPTTFFNYGAIFTIAITIVSAIVYIRNDTRAYIFSKGSSKPEELRHRP